MVEQLTNSITTEMNVYLVLVLMAVGALIKHWSVMDKVSNKLIPPVLITIGVLYGVLTLENYTVAKVVAGICDGIVNSAIAVLLHQTGKNAFTLYTELKASGTNMVITESESEDDP